MVYPSLVGVEKVELTASASSVAASGSSTVKVKLPDGIILGIPIVVSIGADTSVAIDNYISSDGTLSVTLTNTDSANAHDLSATIAVWVYPKV